MTRRKIITAIVRKKNLKRAMIMTALMTSVALLMLPLISANEVGLYVGSGGKEIEVIITNRGNESVNYSLWIGIGGPFLGIIPIRDPIYKNGTIVPDNRTYMMFPVDNIFARVFIGLYTNETMLLCEGFIILGRVFLYSAYTREI